MGLYSDGWKYVNALFANFGKKELPDLVVFKLINHLISVTFVFFSLFSFCFISYYPTPS